MKMVLVYILLNAYYGSSERVHWFIALETIPDKVISIFQELHGRKKLMPTISPLIWTCGQTVHTCTSHLININIVLMVKIIIIILLGTKKVTKRIKVLATKV